MIFQLTCKNCRVVKRSREFLNGYVNKIQREFLRLPDDEIVLKLIIRKNVDRYHPPKVRPHPHKIYSDSKAALAIYEGSITFRLLKRRFYADFKGVMIDECIKTGFDRIIKEIEEFRNLHYPSESDYPDRKTIRGTGGVRFQ